MSKSHNPKEAAVGYRIVSKDNGYFEVVELKCCDQKVRICTEFYQYGITAAKRKKEREFTLRNHKCA